MYYFQKQDAFSLIELSVSFLIIALLVTFTIVSFQRAYEDSEIRFIQSSLVVFQNVLIQGADRLKVEPKDVSLGQVVAAIEPNANVRWDVPNPNPSGIASVIASVFIKRDNQTFPASNANLPTQHRGITFRVNACGSVCPTSLYNFNYYHLVENPGALCPADTEFAGSNKCNMLAST
jgi:type II secretory pathway pseudopilin PulG